MKVFKEQPGCLAIASQLKDEMAAFAPFVPLVKALRDPGMRERHWESLSTELGFDLHPNATFTLRDATDGLQLHAPKTLEVVERACDKARKEYAIEKSLNEMQAAWAELNFEVMPYRNTGTCVIKLSDEVSTILDDHIVLTQQFSFSPYKGPFEERIAQWERQLRLVQEVSSEWLACQRNWMYLQPIFDSEARARARHTAGVRLLRARARPPRCHPTSRPRATHASPRRTSTGSCPPRASASRASTATGARRSSA